MAQSDRAVSIGTFLSIDDALLALDKICDGWQSRFPRRYKGSPREVEIANRWHNFTTFAYARISDVGDGSFEVYVVPEPKDMEDDEP